MAGLVAPPAAVAADTPYLDDSFGERGRAVLDLGGGGVGAVAADVDPHGRTVTVGLLQDLSLPPVLVIRLLPNGELDPAFGEGGVVMFTSLPDVSDDGFQDDGTMSVPPDVLDVEVQDDGKVLVLSRHQMMRLDERGALEETFGASGVAVPGGSNDNNPWQEPIFSHVGIAADGTIAVAGAVQMSDGDTLRQKIAGWRYTAEGVLASSFDQFPADPGNPDIRWAAEDMAVDGAGRVVVAGGVGGFQGRLLRFLPDGRLDATFGLAGSVPLASTGYEVAVSPDGRTVVAQDWRISGYGADGKFQTSSPPLDMQIVSLQIDGAGRVLATGNQTLHGVTSFAVMRLDADRTLDRTFGTGGVVMSAFSEGGAYVAGAVLAPDGDLVATGWINHFGWDPSSQRRRDCTAGPDMTWAGDRPSVIPLCGMTSTATTGPMCWPGTAAVCSGSTGQRQGRLSDAHEGGRRLECHDRDRRRRGPEHRRQG
ncbi:putative delta-60 repeat protein [Arthrobacter globiformis]|nr:putative delta-60 repeat protein [Arthrobacter globiformis]